MTSNQTPLPESQVEDALERARSTEAPPPDDLTASVMAQVTDVEAGLSEWQRGARRAASRRLTNFLTGSRVDSTKHQQRRPTVARGGALVAKKILWGVTGIAAAAIISFVVFGYPPVVPGTEGTVGAAKRYQGTRMTSDDVAVSGDVVQDFMQSESFDYLMKNPDTRAALHAAVTNAALAQVLADAEAMKVLASPEAGRFFAQAEVADALADPDLLAVFSRADVQAALASPEVRALFASADVRASLASPEARVLAAPDALGALARPAAVKMLANPQVAQALASPSIRMMFAQDAMVQVLANPGLVRLFAQPNFSAALADANFQAVFAQPALAQALATPALAQAVAARLQ